jgi:hypothetical protein
MGCSRCDSESLPGKWFCAECGSPLPIRCPKCGAETPANAKFCADCGTALTAIARSGSDRSVIVQSTTKEIRLTLEQGEAVHSTDGERKLVTAVFADIEGSTELMEDLDPEETRTIVDPALKLMIDAVHRYDGYIVQSTGDGIFALFGAPLAHEDHPQRALYAALRMQDEIRRYGGKLQEEGHAPVEIRVGINSGEVVVRSIRTGNTEGAVTSWRRPVWGLRSARALVELPKTGHWLAQGPNRHALSNGDRPTRGSTLGSSRVQASPQPASSVGPRAVQIRHCFISLKCKLSRRTGTKEMVQASTLNKGRSGSAIEPLYYIFVPSKVPTKSPTVPAQTQQPEKSLNRLRIFLERVNGFEPSTLCLASTRSTN